MNKFLIVLVLVSVLASCGQKSAVDKDGNLSTSVIDPENPPVIKFQEKVYNFGTISQGETVSYTFYFTNEGKSSLVLHDVKPSCGCTVLKDWPKEPIAPGEKGKIEITFDSNGISGKVTRAITVYANTKPTSTKLQITGNIAAPTSN